MKIQLAQRVVVRTFLSKLFTQSKKNMDTLGSASAHRRMFTQDGRSKTMTAQVETWFGHVWSMLDTFGEGKAENDLKQISLRLFSSGGKEHCVNECCLAMFGTSAGLKPIVLACYSRRFNRMLSPKKICEICPTTAKYLHT